MLGSTWTWVRLVAEAERSPGPKLGYERSRHQRQIRSSANGLLMTDQSSGRAAKSFFVFVYHLIPETGCLHLSCMLFRALLCVSSPLATISFKWLSSALITSSAVFPWNGASHGPPICLHVIVFIPITSFSAGFNGGTSSSHLERDVDVDVAQVVRRRRGSPAYR